MKCDICGSDMNIEKVRCPYCWAEYRTYGEANITQIEFLPDTRARAAEIRVKREEEERVGMCQYRGEEAT
jgi:hypothetical protein